MFGDKALNLFATEAMAEVMSMGVNHIGATWASRRLGGRIAESFAEKWLDRLSRRTIGNSFAKGLLKKNFGVEFAEATLDDIHRIGWSSLKPSTIIPLLMRKASRSKVHLAQYLELFKEL
jgi:hypothetical protein